jgi:hypothetical protein
MPSEPAITFRSAGRAGAGKEAQWSETTDITDFVRDAAHNREFIIHVANASSAEDSRATSAVSTKRATSLRVMVPTFVDRTRFLRRRLARIGSEMRGMEDLKAVCDAEAHRGARRLARGGLALLVTYWGAGARLTFWDLSWDVMEPVTYLSGLSMVICGYLW